MQAPVVPMSFLRAKPIGVMQMIDQGEQDDKIIAVHADDPEYRDYDDISQLPKHRLAEIRRSVLDVAYSLPVHWGVQCISTACQQLNCDLVSKSARVVWWTNMPGVYHAALVPL